MSNKNENKPNTSAFTAPKNLNEYFTLLDPEYEKINKQDDHWSTFNGFNGLDPHSLQLKAIYDLLRHVMFKLTTTREDVVTAAFAERDWILAENEIDKNNWRMSHSPVLDDEEDEKTDLASSVKNLTEQIEQLTSVVNAIAAKKKGDNINDRLTSLFHNTDDQAVRKGIIKLIKTQKQERVIAAITKAGIGMEDLIA